MAGLSLLVFLLYLYTLTPIANLVSVQIYVCKLHDAPLRDYVLVLGFVRSHTAIGDQLRYIKADTTKQCRNAIALIYLRGSVGFLYNPEANIWIREYLQYSPNFYYTVNNFYPRKIKNIEEIFQKKSSIIIFSLSEHNHFNTLNNVNVKHNRDLDSKIFINAVIGFWVFEM